MKLTAADPEKSRYFFPAESQIQTPSPRTAEGKSLRKDLRITELRAEF